MKPIIKIPLVSILFSFVGLTSCQEGTEHHNVSERMVRLSKIEVYPEYLDDYLKFASEVGRTSVKEEKGVITLYSVQEQKNPCLITILEIYADTAAYRSHIASEHFQKYKKGTLHMVKSLELVDCNPLVPEMKIK